MQEESKAAAFFIFFKIFKIIIIIRFIIVWEPAVLGQYIALV